MVDSANVRETAAAWDSYDRAVVRDAVVTNKPAPDQAVTKHRLGPSQPARKCSLGNAQPARSLVTRKPLKLAEQDDQPERFRQSGELRIEDRPQLACGIVALGVNVIGHGDALLPCPPPCRAAACVLGGAEGHSVEPARQRLAAPDGGRLTSQDQKRCLEGIFRVVGVAQEPPANSHDHRAMPLNQHGERLFGGLIAAGDEPVKQLAVAQVARNAKAKERSQVFEGFL